MSDIFNLHQGYRIPFIQYMRPNGRKVHVEFPTKDEALYNKAQDLIKSGFRFECEELRNGMCSFTVSGLDSRYEDADLAIELSQNGPNVIKAVTKLIMEFDKSKHVKQ